MTADAETVSWIRIVLAFSVVFALLAGLGFALKHIKTRGFKIPGFKTSAGLARLEVMESLTLDVQRRVVILRCDGAEHLVLFGPEGATVIDTHLDANQLSSARIEKPPLRSFLR